MARVHERAPKLHTSFRTMFNISLLQLIFVVTALADKCTRTKAVPVQEQPVKKVHVLRRIPATCSNWDKAWTWLTKKECGTKYRLDYVTVPTRETTEYRLEYVCCDGDTACKKAESVHSGGNDKSDENLAIVLGSVAACVVLVIIIFAITFYTKKTRCPNLCESKHHTYSSADAEETVDARDVEKFNHDDGDSDTDPKACESDYAEIGDPTLPRYTDIFKEPGVSVEEWPGEDPFHRATAPPMYSEVPPNRMYANTSGIMRAPAALHTSVVTDKVQVETSAQSFVIEREDQHIDGVEDLSSTKTSVTSPARAAAKGAMAAATPGEPKYCNVREKKQQKKKKKQQPQNQQQRNSSVVNAGAQNKGENSGVCKVTTKRVISVNNAPVQVDNLVKSSSASETITSHPDISSQKQQKRRSAPENASSSSPAASTSGTQTGSPARSAQNANVCTPIQESPPPLPPREPIKKPKKSSKNIKSGELKVHQQKKSSAKRNKANNDSCQYENREEVSATDNIVPEVAATASASTEPSSENLASTATHSKTCSPEPTPIDNDTMHRTPPVSPSAGSVLSYSRSASLGLNSIDNADDNDDDEVEKEEEEDEDEEMAEASESDSLLRSPSCHSECDHRSFPGCDQCSRDLEYYQLYDQPSLGDRSSRGASDFDGEEGDDISLHVYQSLREVADKTSIQLDSVSTTSSPSPTKPLYINGSVIVSGRSHDTTLPVHHV